MDAANYFKDIRRPLSGLTTLELQEKIYLFPVQVGAKKLLIFVSVVFPHSFTILYDFHKTLNLL